MDVNLIVDELLSIAEFLASEAFKLAVRQIQLKAIIDMIVVVITAFCLIILNKSTWKFQREFWAGDLDRDWNDPHAAIATVYAVNTILSIIMFINLMYVLSYVYNPQWYAVNLLIDTIINK